MSALAEKIRDEIRHLPFGERIRLVKELEDDLDRDEQSAENEVNAAWESEEQSRVEDILGGKVNLLTYEDLNRRLDEVRAKHMA